MRPPLKSSTNRFSNSKLYGRQTDDPVRQQRSRYALNIYTDTCTCTLYNVRGRLIFVLFSNRKTHTNYLPDVYRKAFKTIFSHKTTGDDDDSSHMWSVRDGFSLDILIVA